MAEQTKYFDEVLLSDRQFWSDFWRDFGWKVYSTERYADGKKTDLLFKRDDSMKNYKELVELEEEYNAIPRVPAKPDLPPEPPLPSANFLPLPLAPAVVNTTGWIIGIIIGFIIYVVPGIILTIIFIVKNNMYKEAVTQWTNECDLVRRLNSEREEEIYRFKETKIAEQNENYKKDCADWEAQRNDIRTRREEVRKRAKALLD